MLGSFSLLLKLTEMKDFQFTEFGEVLIEFCNCFWLFSNYVIVQRSGPQSFHGLGNELVVRYFQSLSFQLQNPSVQVGQRLLLILCTGQKIFLSTELHLKPLEV
jgi:hypothetical protein